VLDVNDILTEKFFCGAAWMISHRLLSILLHVQKHDFPNIESLIATWFQAQQERYTSTESNTTKKKGSYIVFAISALDQWQRRMSLIDESMFQSLLLLPMMLEERVHSLAKVDISKLLQISVEQQEAAILPRELCLTLLGAIREKCIRVLEFAIDDSYVENLCLRLQDCLIKVQENILDLHRTCYGGVGIKTSPKSVTRPTSLSVISSNAKLSSDTKKSIKQCVARVTSQLQTVLEFYSVSSIVAIRRALFHIINTLMDEDTNDKLVVIDEQITQTVFGEKQPLTRSFSLSKHWPYDGMEVIKTAIKEMLSFGLMKVTETERKRIPGVLQILREKLTRLFKKESVLYHYQTLLIQSPQAFEPWSAFSPKKLMKTTLYLEYADFEVFHGREEIAFGLRWIDMQIQHLIQSQDSERMRLVNQGQGLADSDMLVCLHREGLNLCLMPALSMLVRYLNEVYHSAGVKEKDRQLFRYHQQCLDLAKETVFRKQSLVDSLISFTAESMLTVSLKTKQNRAGERIGEQEGEGENVLMKCLLVANMSEYYSVIRYGTLLSNISIANMIADHLTFVFTLPIESSVTRESESVSEPDQDTNTEIALLKHRVACLFLMIIVACLRMIVLQHFYAKFLYWTLSHN
jgi:hypothetical protein